MDLERSLANISIDDGWRQPHDPQQAWSTGMGGPGNDPSNWGHVSPQPRPPNVWQDPTRLGESVNAALGFGTGGSGWGAPPDDYGKPLWSEAPPPNGDLFRAGGPIANGSVDGGPEWMRAPSDALPSNPVWSDPLLKDNSPGPASFGNEFWKQPQATGWGQGPPGRSGGWGGMPPVNAPPPGQRPGHHMMHPRGGGGWAPNGMMHHQPHYPMDMSVPPPMDMPMGGHRGMPKPSWKQDGMGPPNGMRNNYTHNNFVPPPRLQQDPMMGGQYPMGPGASDDLMWHDPNGELKKWQRDTGVSVWGDPNKCTQREVKNWTVQPGQEEDLEQALQHCPVPNKKHEGGDATITLAIHIPQKKDIVPTGWGSLPDNDPNNIKSDIGTEKWSEATPDCPWGLPGGDQPLPGGYDANGGWGQQAIPQSAGPVSEEAAAIADQLRSAVEKGYLDMSILHQQMPPEVLTHISQLLGRIPALEEAQKELDALVDSVMPEGETDRSQPDRYMNAVQQTNYNRLIIEVTTARIEVTNLSKKIQRSINESRGLAEDSHQAADPYDSFLRS